MIRLVGNKMGEEKEWGNMRCYIFIGEGLTGRRITALYVVSWIILKRSFPFNEELTIFLMARPRSFLTLCPAVLLDPTTTT